MASTSPAAGTQACLYKDGKRGQGDMGGRQDACRKERGYPETTMMCRWCHMGCLGWDSSAGVSATKHPQYSHNSEHHMWTRVSRGFHTTDSSFTYSFSVHVCVSTCTCMSVCTSYIRLVDIKLKATQHNNLQSFFTLDLNTQHVHCTRTRTRTCMYLALRSVEDAICTLLPYRQRSL